MVLTSLIALVVMFFCVVHSQSTNISLITLKGPIVGLRFQPNPNTGVSYDAFLGIPYGEIPARFQLAGARSNWSEPLYTQTDGLSCPQPHIPFSEDCLFLNVYTPLNASSGVDLLPVMVFIHGAGFTHGNSSSQKYGPDFLVNQSVVLVTMNYRLGAAGFLTLGSAVAPGNLGLHDTLLALQWVQDEISTFGGDPTQVTLFGQSSGSIMTHMHYLSLLSTDLFVRVIAQSGSVLADWGHYTAVEGARRAKVLAQAVNCDTSLNDSALLACLQAANMTDIVNSQFVDGIITTEDEISGNYRVFLPVLDTHQTADKPFFNDTFENLMAKALTRSKPMMTGFTTEDGMLKLSEYDFWESAKDHLEYFIPVNTLPMLGSEERAAAASNISSRYFPDSPDLNKVQSLVQLYTDTVFAYPSVQVTRFFANLTYGYLFAYIGSWTPTEWYFKKYNMLGVNHGDELTYLFYSSINSNQDNATCAVNIPNLNMKTQMVKWWTTFAKTGVPGASWLTVAEGGYRKIDSSLTTINSSAFESHFYSFWAAMENTTSAAAVRLANISVCVLIWAAITCYNCFNL